MNVVQFHQHVNVKNEGLRQCLTFSFNYSHGWFLIGTPTLELFMQRKEPMQEKEEVTFSSLVVSKKLRRMKEGVLVHASGQHENGTWQPMRRTQVWTHLRQRSQEAMA